jgi:hypothetical protein
MGIGYLPYINITLGIGGHPVGSKKLRGKLFPRKGFAD